MVEAEGRAAPLNPVELLRAMVALRDNNPGSTAKRFYAIAKPGKNSGRVVRYFLDKEAASIKILNHELSIPKSSLYGIVDELLGWGVLFEGSKIDLGVRGTNPILYVLGGADPSKIAEAHKFHLELRGTSAGGVMDSPLRQLVAPIIDEMMAFIMKTQDESRWQVPLWEVKDRFRETHGYVPANFDQVVNRLVKEKDWGLRIRG